MVKTLKKISTILYKPTTKHYLYTAKNQPPLLSYTTYLDTSKDLKMKLLVLVPSDIPEGFQPAKKNQTPLQSSKLQKIVFMTEKHFIFSSQQET